MRLTLTLLAAALIAGCAPVPASTPGTTLVTKRATPETRALYANLKRLSAQGKTLFGHADDLAYGFRWDNEPGRSDVREVAGAYPAVYGWDVTRLFAKTDPDLPDPARAAQLKQWILEGHGRGGVITLVWHMPNPVNDTDAWNTTRAVDALIPGGRLNADYRAKLDVLAGFLNGLKDRNGKVIPVFFRPFHEHSGDWFWWGRAHSTSAEFKELWRFTVRYLRDEKHVRNALYTYSTDVFDSEGEYLERYPGDDVIDVIGFDDYHSVLTRATHDVFVRRLKMLSSIAAAHGKLAALTEAGSEALPDSHWWTGTFLPGLKEGGPGIAYALVWRNANNATDKANHFYAPYPGQASAADFVAFKNDPDIMFEDELPDLYRLP